MKESTEVKILMDLDAILDTRIATVARIDEDLATKLLVGDYHKRRSDFLTGVNKEEFDLAYSKRDRTTLNMSQCTNMLIVLKDMLLSLLSTGLATPYITYVTVDVNFYPYDLKDDEIDLILKAISSWIPKLASLHGVNLSEDKITPDFIKNNYDVIIKYHYDTWLEINTKGFEKTLVPEVDLYVPAISFTTDLTDEVLRDIYEETGKHPMDMLKFGLAPFINLQPLDVSAFSAFAPDKLIYEQIHK